MDQLFPASHWEWFMKLGLPQDKSQAVEGLRLTHLRIEGLAEEDGLWL